MQILKIKFTDFWHGFDPENNYFFRLLSKSFYVEITNTPDILIYSSYGFSYLKYSCTRIFYTAENLRPDFNACDFAIGFDYDNDPRYYRLPLYALYMDEPGLKEKLLKKNSAAEALKIWKSKTKFCCMVVSNDQAKKRLQFFEKLSKYKTVDSGGKVMNNVGGPVKDKMAFISDFRFVIAFENASYPGYTTEKIIEPLLADCIPLYWGNPLISKEFNTGRFLNLHGSKSDEELIEEIITIDSNEEMAVKMLMAPKFSIGEIPEAIDQKRILRFLDEIIHVSEKKIPVAATSKKYVHFYKIKKKYFANHIKGVVHKLTVKLKQIFSIHNWGKNAK